jgi:exosortase O
MKPVSWPGFASFPTLRARLPGAWQAALNLGLLAAWVWLYLPVFQYLAAQSNREEFRTNLILLVVIAGLIAYRARQAHLRPRLDRAPHLYLPAFLLALAASSGYLLVERFLDINTLSALLFGLASYGLLGLWLEPYRWRQGIPAMLLVVGILPFGEHLETFVGYPLRTFTAGLVRDGLNALGFHSVGVDTILVFESGISQVDIPCSGVKSLWTGALFLLAATWIENRRLGISWLLAAAATALLLFLANLVRVTLISLTGPALGWTLLAQMLHVPLGVLGFVAVCAAALFILRRLPVLESHPAPASTGLLPRPAWLGPLLVLCALLFALVYAPRGAVQALASRPAPAWLFSQDWQVRPAPLSTQEQEWIRETGATTADRYTFRWQPAEGASSASATAVQPLAGTIMLLSSQTWRGQHRPERCFEVFGLSVQESFTYLEQPDFPLRFLALSGSGAPGPVSAVYWLQSTSLTTADFGQRIWADLSPQRERWILVTVLFDRRYDPQLPELASFLTALHTTVSHGLTEGGLP